VEQPTTAKNTTYFGDSLSIQNPQERKMAQFSLQKTAGDKGVAEQSLVIKGKIVQYALALKNKGRTPETIRTYLAALYTLSNKGANILDPTNVEEVIAKQENWTQRSRRNCTDWYARFAKFLHIEWEKPNCKAPDKIPFFPLETEIGQLISGTTRKASIALQIAKETAARVGEIVRITWTDIDFQSNTIAINAPEKGSNTGIYNVTSELLARIQTLPRSTERIFGKASVDSITNTLISARKKLAFSFCNPRLIQIHFHTLRHWKLTAYAHAVKDPLLVQMFAIHKDMKSTSGYIHYAEIVYQRSHKDEWTVRAAKTVEEATELVSVGFEYVTEVEGFKLFKKRK
jgi:integrase